jgi:cardiolipin synthase
MIARKTKQWTKLGAFLDPLADKALLITAFIVFTVYGWIPLWLTITIISRDIIVTIGWLLLYLTSHPQRIAPTMTGKCAVASEIILIAYILTDINFPPLPDVPPAAYGGIALLSIASGLQYIIRGLAGDEK